MPLLNISDIAIKRFCYCPRWYYIHYLLGFRPKTPVKSKFIIYDALQKTLATRNIKDFTERCNDLSRSESIAEENVALDEMIARGELLAAEALKWLSGLQKVTWQEQLVTYTPENCNEVVLEGYPKLVAEKNGQVTLFHVRVAYDGTRPMDILGYYYATILQMLGLKQAGINIQKHVLTSFIVRDRKERNSARAKTPIVEIKEDEMLFSTEFYIQQLTAMIEAIQLATLNKAFPALGVIDGTCVWCPNGRFIKDRILCEYPDDILQQFAETSLQRTSIERWRDEF